MSALCDNCIGLAVTSPPYFVGKSYEADVAAGTVPTSYLEYIEMLRAVFTETFRVLEPGGRLAVNVANLGRRPYRSLVADVVAVLSEIGFLLRGEIVWVKGKGASGNAAWGSWRAASNPVLRDVTERVIVASKWDFARAIRPQRRKDLGLPHESTITSERFLEATLDTWYIRPESATRIGHAAPFPLELPRRLIELYTYATDTVLDPFIGSGTTALAALELGRHYVGYDTDPGALAVAQGRLAHFS